MLRLSVINIFINLEREVCSLVIARDIGSCGDIEKK